MLRLLREKEKRQPAAVQTQLLGAVAAQHEPVRRLGRAETPRWHVFGLGDGDDNDDVVLAPKPAFPVRGEGPQSAGVRVQGAEERYRRLQQAAEDWRGRVWVRVQRHDQDSRREHRRRGEEAQPEQFAGT